MLERYRDRFEGALDTALSQLDGPLRLKEACSYALKTGGKRIRPALVYMVAECVDTDANVDGGALCVEYLHTASLIADDLPCMDNDDLRRDRPSTHKQFGEATALLASYALIAAAYDVVSTKRAPTVVPLISKAIGLQGTAGGQFLDIHASSRAEQAFIDVCEKKTATLFEVAFAVGWLLAGGSEESIESVKAAGKHLGTLFQICDDVLDAAEDTSPFNGVHLLGPTRLQSVLDQQAASYREHLTSAALASAPLINLADDLTQRALAQLQAVHEGYQDHALTPAL